MYGNLKEVTRKEDICNTAGRQKAFERTGIELLNRLDNHHAYR